MPKDEPMLKIATKKKNSDARRTIVVKDLFAMHDCFCLLCMIASGCLYVAVIIEYRR